MPEMYPAKKKFWVVLVLLLCSVPLQTQVLSHPRKTKPLARGIADIQAQIERNTELAADLETAVQDHLQSMGEIIYTTYGQKRDPGRVIVELKRDFDDLLSAAKNGATGQVWPAVGQFGQALLDCVSTADCYSIPGQRYVEAVNVVQQLTWETLRLKTTLSELDGYQGRIAQDAGILQKLERESHDLQNDSTSESNGDISEFNNLVEDDKPVLPTTPPGTNFAALDDAVLFNRWLGLGNRAFSTPDDETAFYQKFPSYQRFQAAAETHSPIDEIKDFITRCGSIGKTDLGKTADTQGTPGMPSHIPSMAEQIAAVGAFLSGIKNGCSDGPPK